MPFSTCERIVEMNPTPRIPSFPRMGIQQLQSLALDPRCRGGDDFAAGGISSQAFAGTTNNLLRFRYHFGSGSRAETQLR